MTDPVPDPTPSPDFPEDGLVVVPTLAGYQHLVERVEQLEADTPATVPAEDAGEAVTLASLSGRIDRHRTELEAIKTWCRDVSRFLGLPTSSTPTTPPAAATTPGSYQ